MQSIFQDLTFIEFGADTSSVNGCVLCGSWKEVGAEGQKTASTDCRARSQLSIKKRTTKTGGDGEAGAFLAWVCSSSPNEALIKGVHDRRCDHSRTVARNLYPGSVAGSGHFRLGRLVLPEHEPSYLGLTYLGTSTKQVLLTVGWSQSGDFLLFDSNSLNYW